MLIVIVRGPPKSGKTAAALTIAEALWKRGNRVQVIDDTTAPHLTACIAADYAPKDPTVQVITEETRG